jgi:hypothetical protein
VHGVDERGIVGPVAMVAGFDGPGQQPVRGVHVTIAVDQKKSGRVGRVQGAGGVQGRPARVGQQRRGVVDRTAGLGADVRGLGEPPSATRARRAQFTGADQGRDRGEGVSAQHHLMRGFLEQLRHCLVRTVGGRGQVPRAAFVVAGQGTGQRDVGVPALLVGGHRHDRRPDQRVPERDQGGGVVHPDQLGSFRRREIGQTGPVVQGAPKHPDVAGALEGGQQQQAPGRVRQSGQARGEHSLESVAERDHLRLCHGTGDRTEQCGRQLHQRQRITLREVEQSLPDPRRHLRMMGADQLRGGIAVDRLDDLLGQTPPIEEARRARPGGHQQAGPTVLQPPGDEAQHHGARAINPLNVVDHQDQRRVSGEFGQQQERGVADEQGARRRAGTESESDRQCVTRPGRKALEIRVHR